VKIVSTISNIALWLSRNTASMQYVPLQKNFISQLGATIFPAYKNSHSFFSTGNLAIVTLSKIQFIENPTSTGLSTTHRVNIFRNLSLLRDAPTVIHGPCLLGRKICFPLKKTNQSTQILITSDYSGVWLGCTTPALGKLPNYLEEMKSDFHLVTWTFQYRSFILMCWLTSRLFVCTP